MQYAHNIDNNQSIEIRGQSGYSILGDRIFINIDEIANNRDMFNTSGTLSLELWALDQPYWGADFQGIFLAGTTVGEIFGQYSLYNNGFDLIFQQPPAGLWNLVLMVREWEDGAYVTRDYVNFNQPYLVEFEQPIATQAIVHSSENNIIEVDFGDAGHSASTTQEKAETHIEQPKAKTAKATKSKPKAVAKTAKTKVATQQAQPTSVNNSSADELADVKGISKKLAQAIVEGRPYKNLEELLKVKGMGKKVLEKVQDMIKL